MSFTFSSEQDVKLPGGLIRGIGWWGPCHVVAYCDCVWSQHDLKLRGGSISRHRLVGTMPVFVLLSNPLCIDSIFCKSERASSRMRHVAAALHGVAIETIYNIEFNDQSHSISSVLASGALSSAVLCFCGNDACKDASQPTWFSTSVLCRLTCTSCGELRSSAL